MIDATKSPVPAWRRYATFAVLALLILIAIYFVWSKELHHASTTGSAPAPVTSLAPAHTGPTPPRITGTPPTTIPGGIPISPRNPFGS